MNGQRGYQDEREDEPIELDRVLEPDEEDLRYDNKGYDEAPYDPISDEDELDAQEESTSRFRVAMGFFDTVSTLVGVVVILVLTALLISLINWLVADIRHSLLLLQSGIQ